MAFSSHILYQPSTHKKFKECSQDDKIVDLDETAYYLNGKPSK